MRERSGPPDYGESFADVYDDWYAGITDAEGTADRVEHLAKAADSTRVLELGIGSGRLAFPIADRGLEVVGIDSSRAMLDRLAANLDQPAATSQAERITVVQGDMAEADHLVEGPFGVILIAFNTLFNLVSPSDQLRCLQACARLLAPQGSLLIEAVVPAEAPERTERGLSTTRVDLDRVVLAATEHDPATQVITGQHIDITSAGVRLRPWQIRYLTPDQIDDLARSVGLTLAERHADWAGAPWSSGSPLHISRYRRSPDTGAATTSV